MAIRMIYLVVLALVLCCTMADKCPKSCDCDSLTRKVVCEYFWTKLPPLPKGTLHLEMRSPYFRQLTGPESCSDYSNLTVLLISDYTIESISKDALHCIPALQTLKVLGLRIKDLHWDTFKQTHHLKQIHLGIISSSNVLPKLCMIKGLEIIELTLNIVINNSSSLDCLGSMPSLSDVKIQGVITRDLGELVKPFRNLTNSFSMEYCKKFRFRDNALDGFKVQFLSFRGTRIGRLNPRMFKYLNRLKTLDLSKGAIAPVLLDILQFYYPPSKIRDMIPLSEIRYMILPFNLNISDLNLSNNRFQTIYSYTFVNLIYLSVLNLQSCKIAEINENAFLNLPKLESLILSNNNIQNFSNVIANLITATAFPHKHLDLSENPLHTIERPSANLGFQLLEILHLNNSKIKRIEAGAFDIFTNLKELDLASNYLLELGPNMFQKFRFLEKLDLSHNNLVKLDTKVHGLQDSSLVELYLQRNRLRAVSIWNMTTLETLNIGENGFHEFELHIQGTPSLKKLYTRKVYATIKEIYPYNCTLFSRLEYADMSESITLLPLFWDGFEVKLRCSLNALIELKLAGFCGPWFLNKNFPQLRILHTNKCSLFDLETVTFSSKPNLRIMDASSNYITALKPNLFRNVSRLESLNLNDNLISQVNWTFFINLKHLRILYLENNPLVCTCDVLYILQAIRSPSMTLTIPGYVECTSPEDVRRSVKDLPLSLEQCEDRWASISGYALLCPVIIVMIFTVIHLWRLRWHIKYTMFLAKAGVGRYAEQCDGKDYLFDAFLAYSEKDLKWVTDQLLKNMDTEFIGEEGLNMCLHHRDWLAGVEITENIRRSIAASRRTIVILSKEFASSYWCRFELAMAHMNLETDKSGRLLVILLEHIPDELLCPHIVHILTTKTYLAWPTDEESQKYFWKALRKSMKKELLYQ